jgi:hypothetical protein
VARGCAFFLVLAVAAIGGGIWVFYPTDAPESATSFHGDSDELKQTTVVPTLETPIPDGQSAVWCASFQLAWDKLKSDVVKGPVEITNAKEVCDRLNKAEFSARDLPGDAFFAAAGWAKDGIVEAIRDGMSRKFPHVPLKDLPDFPDGILAYAWLEAKVVYGHPYLVNPASVAFQGGSAEQKKVGTFGIPMEHGANVTDEMLGQCGALFAHYDDMDNPVDYAVDLDLYSHPNQMVLACVSRESTLGETFAQVQKKIRTFDPGRHDAWKWTLTRWDTLLVPNMRWEVRHNFRELLGKDLKLNGKELPIVLAEQTVQFWLDSNGAGVKSRASLVVGAPRSRHFHFDRPFLLYLKKRDADRPFFVMWVENAELLSGSGS